MGKIKKAVVREAVKTYLKKKKSIMDFNKQFGSLKANDHGEHMWNAISPVLKHFSNKNNVLDLDDFPEEHKANLDTAFRHASMQKMKYKNKYDYMWHSPSRYMRPAIKMMTDGLRNKNPDKFKEGLGQAEMYRKERNDIFNRFINYFRKK